MRDTCILVMAEAPRIRRQLGGFFEGVGFSVKAVATVEEGLAQVRRNHIGAAIVATPLSGIKTSALLHRLRAVNDHLPVIVLSADIQPDHVIEAMRGELSDLLGKPLTLDELERAVRQVLETAGAGVEDRLGTPLPNELTPQLELWSSPRMREIRTILAQVSKVDIPVLIRGETGAGKDVLARAIHALSPRRDGPFLKVNCAAMPSELLESEFFGHEKGAFTGAWQRKLGKFELANKGTILLDEIGDLHPTLQGKLLHVLQDGEFARVGGQGNLTVDVRVLAATNHDLESAVSVGRFREDLLYRLNVVTISVPPLRERLEEIPAFVTYFVDRYRRQFNRPGFTIGAEAMEALQGYDWPGNVREVENLIKRMIVLDDPDIPLRELKPRIREESLDRPPGQATPGPISLREARRQAVLLAERGLIQKVLEETCWNRVQAARLLKISYRSLLHKIRETGLGGDQASHPAGTQAVIS